MGFKIGLTKKRKEILEKELEFLIPQIIKIQGVEKIILFGSLGSDNIHKSSDIDLIIVQKTKKKFLERLDDFYNCVKLNVAADILIYTPEEFNEMKNNNLFIKSALRNGKIIYER